MGRIDLGSRHRFFVFSGYSLQNAASYALVEEKGEKKDHLASFQQTLQWRILDMNSERYWFTAGTVNWIGSMQKKRAIQRSLKPVCVKRWEKRQKYTRVLMYPESSPPPLEKMRYYS